MPVTMDMMETWSSILSSLLEEHSPERILQASDRCLMRTSHWPSPSSLVEQLEEMGAPDVEGVTLVEYRRQVSKISQFWWSAYRHADPSVQGQVDRILRECHADRVPPYESLRKFNNLLLESHPLAKSRVLEDPNQANEQRNIQRDTLVPSLPMPDQHVVTQAQEASERADRDTESFTSLAELLRGHPDGAVLDRASSD